MQRRGKKYAKPLLVDPYRISLGDFACMMLLGSCAITALLLYAFF